MATIKDRVGRLEGRMNVVVDRTAIEADAKAVTNKLVDRASRFQEADAEMPLSDRAALMSVADHVAWSIRFVPGFVLTTDVIEDFKAMQIATSGRVA